MSFLYSQKTGDLYDSNRQWVTRGYSGHGAFKNQPSAEQVVDMGPIPAGDWKILGPPLDTEIHGPYVLSLMPCPETETHGRFGFLIHGDSIENQGSASRGCIIIPRQARELIWESGDHLLTVVPQVSDTDATPPGGTSFPPQEGEV